MDIGPALIFLSLTLWLIAVTARAWLYAKTQLWALTSTHELALVRHIVALCVAGKADTKQAALWLARYHIVLPAPLLDTAFQAELSGHTESYPFSKN